MKYFTGVGSRDITPQEKAILVEVSRNLATRGFICRSGLADGADQAVQEGACLVSPEYTEIWLPSSNFKKELQQNSIFKGSNYHVPTKDEFEEAREIYLDTGIISWYDTMKPYAQAFHGRNYRQVVGKQAKIHSKVCIYCAPEKNGKVRGGTRSAVELSRLYKIPTYNIRIPEQKNKLFKVLGLIK